MLLYFPARIWPYSKDRSRAPCRYLLLDSSNLHVSNLIGNPFSGGICHLRPIDKLVAVCQLPCVHKNIRTTTIWNDKTEALVIIPSLHSPLIKAGVVLQFHWREATKTKTSGTKNCKTIFDRSGIQWKQLVPRETHFTYSWSSNQRNVYFKSFCDEELWYWYWIWHRYRRN